MENLIKIQLEFLDIFPSLSDLSNNNPDSLSFNIPSINHSSNLSTLISSSQTLDISIPKITFFTISKNDQTIATAPFTIVKGVQWIQFNYEYKTKLTSFVLNLLECIKIKIRCIPHFKKISNKTTSINKKLIIRNKIISKFENKSPLIKGSVMHNDTNHSTITKKEQMNKDMHNRSFECSINFEKYFDDVKDEEPTTNTTATTAKNKNKNNIVTTFSNYCNYKLGGKNGNVYMNTETKVNKTVNTSMNKTRNVNGKGVHVQKIQKGLKKEKLSELTLNHNGINTDKPLNSSLISKERNSLNKYILNNNSNTKYSKHTKTNSNYSENKNNDIINNENNNHSNNISISTFPTKSIVSPFTYNKDDFLLNSTISEELIKLINVNNNNNIHQLYIQNFEQEPLDTFTQLKNDFNIQYSNTYIKNIPNDLLKLEVELLIEKLFEIVTSYHSQLDNVKYIYDKISSLSKDYYFKYIKLNHNYKELQHQKEKIICKPNQINIYKQIQNIFNISKNEINLFNTFINNKNKSKHNKNIYLKELMYKILYEKGKYNMITNENEKMFVDKCFANRKNDMILFNKDDNKGMSNRTNVNGNAVGIKEKNKKGIGMKRNMKRKY